MRSWQWMVGLVLMGCAAEPATAIEASDDEGHEDVFQLTTPETIGAELSASPSHAEDLAFVRTSLLYRSATELPFEVSTSPDGRTWSDWQLVVSDPEGSDDEVGVWLADAEVFDGNARFWRIRLTGGESPSELSVATSTVDELYADMLTDEDEAFEPAQVDANGFLTVGASGMHRYRFDFGSVTRSWHWLLRNARRRGWRGSLYGHSTGLRTYAQQAALWNAYQNGTGNPAFPPWGPSRHLIRNVTRVGRWYQAVDTSYVPDLIRIARGLGVSLHTPYSGEPWHVEATRAFSPPRGYRP